MSFSTRQRPPNHPPRIRDARLVCCLVALLALSGNGWAQRSPVVQLGPTTHSGPQLRWPSLSVVPAPGRPVFATYQVEQSEDLIAWRPISEPLVPAGAMLQFDAPASNSPRSFYRVSSSLDLEFANLGEARLDNGDFRFARLFGASLFAANLFRANLADADLRAADLRSANFSGANLTRANLRAADLLNATLESANFRDADLSFAQLGNAFMLGGDLTGTDLRSAVMPGADLRGVSLRGAKLDAETVLDAKWRLVWRIVNQGATGLVLRGVDLSETDLAGADLHGVDFGNGDLSGVDVSGADVRGANFLQANLRFADFRGTKADATTRFPPKWRTVWELVNQGGTNRNLQGLDLSVSFLFRVNLSGADLRNANLFTVSWFIVDLTGANLANANLSNAILTRSDLSHANLRGANLNGAQLDGVIFNETTMPDGTIRSQ